MSGPRPPAGTLLFLYLRTGGGHLAPVQAVSGYIEREYGDRVRTVLVDGLERASRVARTVIEDGYRLLQARARWYYEFLYFVNKIPPLGSWTASVAAWIVTPLIREAILRERPTTIVIAHFLLIKPVATVIREEGLSVRTVVLVTDPYTAHPMWFLNPAMEFIVFSERLARWCVGHGMNAGRLHVFPFVISERFSTPLPPDDRARVRASLDIPPDRKVVLVLGGGDGIPRGETIVRLLLGNVTGAALLVVCGRNADLERSARRLVTSSGRTDVRVFGYVTIVYDLINISDIVVSKCGASTFMEILLSGKIPVVTDYLWEQEKGNKDFLQQEKLGFFEPRLDRLSLLLNRLLQDESLYEECQRNLRTLGLCNGTPLVARWLVETTT